MTKLSLLDLPEEILVLLPEHLHTIEDYVNLSSSCNKLRRCCKAVSPNALFRLAAAQSSVFFRPSPDFLVVAVARELGHWARQSDANEATFVRHAQQGVDGLLELALQHCGLTVSRVRELHAMRFTTINRMTDIVDKCVGAQWYATPEFWDGGVDDAYTIDAEPSLTVFHLALYGELFGPDLDAYFNGGDGRVLSVDTRLEVVKYCIPDWASLNCVGWGTKDEDGEVDSRRAVRKIGPYASEVRDEQVWANNNIALTWLLRSSRWRPRLKSMRKLAGVFDFAGDDFIDGWWFGPDEDPLHWRQRLLENVMVCQGLQGFEMVVPSLRERWTERVRLWGDAIRRFDAPPANVHVGRQATHVCPYLIGDLRICVSGYVGGS